MPDRLKSPALASLLFALNVYICRGLFGIEYLRHMGSIEGAFIGISRYMLDHWRDLSWFPGWYAGIPVQNMYPPLLHAMVALAAGIAHVSPAHAYHFVTALFYCVGPVTLFALVLRLSKSRWTAFFGAAFYSVFSPSGWLMAKVAADAGGIWHPVRLRDLVVYGEGPHIASMTLLPLALLLLDRALERRRWVDITMAALAIGSVALTNWLGIFALALTIAAYLLSRIEVLRWRDVGLLALIAVAAYALAMPWIPPSTVATIQQNAKHNGGDFSQAYRILPLTGTLALLALAGLKLVFRRTTLVIQFAVFLTVLLAAPPLLSVWAKVDILPLPARYHLELEMALAMLAALIGHTIIKGSSRKAVIGVTAALVLILVPAVQVYDDYARRELIQSIDITTTSEWKTAQWLNRNGTGGRVMVPGSIRFWLTAFSDTPEPDGGFDQGLILPVVPMATYQIATSDGAGTREAEIAVQWLKALGVEIVGVSLPGSTEVYKEYKNPHKYDGVLQPIRNEGGDVLYAVPHQGRIAHVMKKSDLAPRMPVNGIDTDPLVPYVTALDLPSSTSFEWTSAHSAAIRADLRPGEIVSIQIAWHAGWHAEVNGSPEPILKDALGFMYLEPSATGAIQIALTYDGGTEMRLARWLSGITAVVLLIGNLTTLRPKG